MAVTKTIMKLTDVDAVVKIGGSAGSAVISLATDLLHSSQVIDGATQTVNIVGLMYVGGNNSLIVVERPSGTITLTLGNSGSSSVDFQGQDMPPDIQGNTSDITVTISGTAVTTGDNSGQVWLKLRKVSGYQSKIEDWKYGSYEDPTRVGASTTVNGSPDFGD